MKIKILNRTYELKTVSAVLTADNGIWGVINHSNLEIEIRKDVEGIVKFETFLHECIHSIDSQLNLEFDEKIIDKLACGFMSIVENNDLKKIKEFLK